MKKCHFLVLAGGVGSRFGLDIPKQFVELDGKPIIVYALKKIQVECISEITIVCIKDWIPYLEGAIKKYDIHNIKKIVPGGATVHQSIYTGLKAIEEYCESKDDIIVIHDAVRPLLPEKVILDSIDKAEKYGNGCASLKSNEGLVIKDDEMHGSTIADRYNIMRIQTPQAYNYGLIRDLYDKAFEEGREYPYADGICLSNGVPIYFSRSFSSNIKITTKPDLAFMRAMIQFSDDELMGEGGLRG